jgi:hypothetical protein
MDGRIESLRTFDAHQQMHDLFLISLLATHPEPGKVLRLFRTLLDGLTASTPDALRQNTFLLAVKRSAIHFERMVDATMPVIGPCDPAESMRRVAASE